jgi:ABC-type transport system involved in cytochrome c biogenesis ATPase subunit
LTLARFAVARAGPNGCGKSTLLRALAGLDRELDAGEVQVRAAASATAPRAHALHKRDCADCAYA